MRCLCGDRSWSAAPLTLQCACGTCRKAWSKIPMEEEEEEEEETGGGGVLGGERDKNYEARRQSVWG